MNNREKLKNSTARMFLRDGRKHLGLSQKDFGAITGYTRQMIVDYEGGRATTPGDLILKLQKLLDGTNKTQ